MNCVSRTIICGLVLMWIGFFLALVEISGGILSIWNKKVMERVEEFIGNFIITCSFINVEGNLPWAFVGIYGRTLIMSIPCHGRSLLVSIVCRTYLCTLVVISISLGSQVNAQEFVGWDFQWQNSLIFLFSSWVW